MPTCCGSDEHPHGGMEMVADEESDEERPLAGGERSAGPTGCTCAHCRNVLVVRTYVCARCGTIEEVDVTPSHD